MMVRRAIGHLWRGGGGWMDDVALASVCPDCGRVDRATLWSGPALTVAVLYDGPASDDVALGGDDRGIVVYAPCEACRERGRRP
jgi:hypothetical protein